MDYEPYDEKKHGAVERASRGAWDGFFKELSSRPLVIKNDGNTRPKLYRLASTRGLRISVRVLPDPEYVVVTLVGQL